MEKVKKNAIIWDVMSCGSCKNDVLEERKATIIRVTRSGELVTTLAVTINRRMLSHIISSQRASVVS
jgi:hypothetical protein